MRERASGPLGGTCQSQSLCLTLKSGHTPQRDTAILTAQRGKLRLRKGKRIPSLAQFHGGTELCLSLEIRMGVVAFEWHLLRYEQHFPRSVPWNI